MIAAMRYHKTQGETASGPRLMVLLFEAAIKNTRMGIAALAEGRRAQAVQHLTKASDIVAHLDATLDKGRAPEICENLSRVYKFTAGRLTSAACKGDVKAAREAERAFAPVADAFAKAVQLAGGKP